MFQFNLLPPEAINKICGNGNSKTKRKLSRLDRKTREAVLKTIQWIGVFSPCRSLNGRYPVDVLVRVITRYPGLGRITFNAPSSWKVGETFEADAAPYVEALISHLKRDPEKHPLSSVKRIEFREFNKGGELSDQFLDAISHQGLEAVKIKTSNQLSSLTSGGIQSVLENSPNVKKLGLDGGASCKGTLSLSFANHPQLSKVNLIN